MSMPLDRCTELHRTDAAAELVAELAQFSYDGLIQLQQDLADGRVLRGSWAGCVISYKRGAAGSTRRDRKGRARNAFTALWDSGWMTDEEVASAVARELRVREVSEPRPAGAGAEPAGDPASRRPPLP